MNKLDEVPFVTHMERLDRVARRYKVSPVKLVGTILREWFATSHPSLAPPNLPTQKSLRKSVEVAAFVSMLTRDRLLNAAYWLSSAYAQFVGVKRRKSLSMFFTPPTLTARLLDDLETQGVSFDEGTFCDPACGGAAFLVPIAIRMKAVLNQKGASDKQIIKHIEQNLIGIDLDPTLCELSRQFLRAVLSDEISSTGIEPKFNISNGDALRCAGHLSQTIDVVVCNPPYRKMTSEEVDAEKTEYSGLIKGQPNIYGLFIALGVKLVRKGGLCAVVTPTSFLSGHSFSKLRCFLMENAETLMIGVVGDRTGVFIDVLQETALTILRRSHFPNTGSAQTSVSLVSIAGEYTAVGNCVLPNSGAAWPIPRITSDVRLLEKSSRLVHRLKDYGYALRIGNFVWNRDTRRTYISKGTARRFRQQSAVPLLWSSDIRPDGTMHFDGERKSNGESCFVDLGSKKHPSIINRPCVVLQRVTSNDQARRLVAADVPVSLLKRYGGFVGENHVVILEPCTEKPWLSPPDLAKLLSTESVDRYFRCISGATNVSIFELNQLPLPDPAWLKDKLTSGVAMELAVREAMSGKPPHKNRKKIDRRK